MEMKDMKLPKKTEKELKDSCAPCTVENQEQYPYGLQLRFETEQIDKLPSLVDYKIGDKLIISAEASVMSIRMSERQGGKSDHTVEMQIEKISCEPKVKKPLSELSPKEYRKARQGE